MIEGRPVVAPKTDPDYVRLPPAWAREHYPAYLHKLDEALWRWSDAERARVPGAFSYRGADLTGAVVCREYQALRDSDPHLCAFARAALGLAPEPAIVDTPLQVELGRWIVSGPAPLLRTSRRRQALRLGHLSARWLRELARRRLNYSAPSPDPPDSSTVLFFAWGEKMIRLFEPVLEALELPYAISGVQSQPQGTGLSHAVTTPALKRYARPGLPGRTLRGDVRLLRVFDLVLEELEDLGPSVVVVAEGSGPFDEAVCAAARLKGISIVCLQHGWAPWVDAGFRRKAYDQMLVWGEGFADMLRPHNPGVSYTPVGNPAPSGVGHGGPRAGMAFFLQSPLIGVDRLRYGDLVDVIDAVAGEHPLEPMLVREHPGFPLPSGPRARLERHDNVTWCPPHEVSLGDVLRRVHLCISVGSTVLWEAPIHGVVPVAMPPPNVSFSPLGDVGVVCASPADVREVVARTVADASWLDKFRPAIARYRRQYCPWTGRDAAERAAAVIRSLCPPPA